MKVKLLLILITCSLLLLVGFVKIPATKKTASSQIVYVDSAITQFFKRTNGWVSSDGGLTVSLTDGRVLWLMGDSHINDYDMATGTVACLFQVRNCALLQPKNDWTWQNTKTLYGNKYSGSKSYFKFNPSDTYFTWPGAGIQIKDTIYVFCSNLKNTGGGGAFGFKGAGNDLLAKIKYPEMTVEGYKKMQDFAGINYGTSMIENKKDGYVYVYGSKLRVIPADIYVARFPVKHPNAAWTFWNGKDWSANAVNSKPITRTPSNSVSACKVKNKYLIFTTEFSVDCDQGKRIFVATADNPTGPFTKSKSIYSITDRKNGHSPFFYSVFGHPEFINDKDELLVTYSINGYGKCVVDCVNGRSDPDVYRPRGIRVPLKLIDPSL